MATSSVVAYIQSIGIRITLTLALTCAFWSSAAHAQSTLHIDAALGFSETFRLGNWAPLTVTVENTGNLVEGTLEVDVASGDQLNGTVFTTTTQRALQLTPGARKRYQFTVFLNNFSVPVVIRIVSDGAVLLRHSIDLRQRFTDSHLLLVLSRNADLDFLNESSSRQVRVAYPHPDLLPNQWQGYDGVAAMVVHGVTLTQWTERQFQAVRKWLGQGGTLIVSGGPDYASLRTPRLAELLPAVPDGLTVVNNDENFRTVLGDSFSASRPFQMHQVPNAAKLTTFKAGELPLLIEKGFGLGRIVYMTFDIGAYPFSGWTGMPQLWLWKLGLAGQDIIPALPTVEASAVPALFKDSGQRFPPRMIVLSFVVAYFGFVAALYRVVFLGSRKNLWLAWFAPLVFIPVTWLLFVTLLSPAATHAAAVSVITPIRNAPFARLELDIGLYSNRPGLSFLQMGQPDAVFLPGVNPDRQDQAADWLHRVGDTTKVRVLDRHPYVLHTLKGLDIIEFELDVSVGETAVGLEVRVQNKSHQALEYAWLVFDGWLYPLGFIEAVQDARLSITADRVVSVYDRKALAKHLKDLPESRIAEIQIAFFHTVNKVRNEAPLKKKEALFMALPQAGRPVLVTDNLMRATEVSLVVSRLAVTSLKPEPGGPEIDAR